MNLNAQNIEGYNNIGDNVYESKYISLNKYVRKKIQEINDKIMNEGNSGMSNYVEQEAEKILKIIEIGKKQAEEEISWKIQEMVEEVKEGEEEINTYKEELMYIEEEDNDVERIKKTIEILEKGQNELEKYVEETIKNKISIMQEGNKKMDEYFEKVKEELIKIIVSY